jgi:hypothetical protein
MAGIRPPDKSRVLAMPANPQALGLTARQKAFSDQWWTQRTQGTWPQWRHEPLTSGLSKTWIKTKNPNSPAATRFTELHELEVIRI